MGDKERKAIIGRCCVPGCNTGRRSERDRAKESGDPPASLFKVPQNPKTLQLWEEAIPKKNRKPLTFLSSVCELHFSPDDVIKFFEMRVRGTIHMLLREKFQLREGAMPVIFPSEEDNIPPKLIKRKQPKEPPIKLQKVAVSPNENVVPSNLIVKKRSRADTIVGPIDFECFSNKKIIRDYYVAEVIDESELKEYNFNLNDLKNLQMGNRDRPKPTSFRNAPVTILKKPSKELSKIICSLNCVSNANEKIVSDYYVVEGIVTSE